MKTRSKQKHPDTVSRPSLAKLYAMGKSLREKCPRSSHAVWKVPDNRPDPLRLLEQSNEGRIKELIPIRYGRMVRTPFTFYRGAPLNMAADLAATPVMGLRVQACGDCHLLNFGAYATPERRLVFDIIMQSASDIFLGWAKGKLGRHIYVRQLKDMKIGVQTELFSTGWMVEYAAFCGWALTRAHARSGAPAQISGYLGKSDAFDKAIADFASAYADQSERDHAILKKAARSGQVEVVMETDRD